MTDVELEAITQMLRRTGMPLGAVERVARSCYSLRDAREFGELFMHEPVFFPESTRSPACPWLLVPIRPARRNDIAAIRAAYDEAVAASTEIWTARFMRSPLTEARLLAAMICDEGVLAQCDDVEVDDFSHLPYRAAFASLRELQASGSPIGILEIADDIAMDDIAHEKCVGETVNALFLGELICDEPKYTDAILLERDKAWLRTLATRRAAS